MIKRIDNAGSFKLLRQEWEELLTGSSNGSVFLSWEWQYNWWVNLGKNRLLYILAFYQESQLIGLAPFYVSTMVFAGIKYRVLRLISDQRYVARELDILYRQGFEQTVADQLRAYLLEHKEDWDIVNLFGSLEGSFTYNYFFGQKKKLKYFQLLEKRKYSMVDLSNWENYLGGLKPRRRTLVRSLLKQYGELQVKGQMAFSITTSPTELPEQLQSFITLHQKRWEKEAEIGMFGVAGTKDFFEQVTGDLLASGRLMFVNLKYQGKYIAHQFCLVYNNVVHLSNEAFDIDVHDFDAGNMLRAKLFNYLNSLDINTYDFLNNFSYHKASWGAKVYKQWTIMIGRRSFKNFLYFGYRLSSQAVKKFLKRILPSRVVKLEQNVHQSLKRKLIKKDSHE